MSIAASHRCESGGSLKLTRLHVNIAAMAEARSSGRSYRGASAAQRRAERRARLIEAAVTVYGQRGYRSASVKAVCEEAGLTERYFYESFANSEALLAAAYQAVVDILLARLRDAAAAAPGGGDAKVRAILSAYYQALREDPRSARLFLVELAGVSAEIDAVLAASLQRFAQLLAETLGARPAAGHSLLAAGVVGGIVHLATLWVRSGYAAQHEVLVAAAFSLCGLLSPMKADPLPPFAKGIS
jgi:AcrR family transcriptional regulator